MPMQPRPSAETAGPSRPRVRCRIGGSRLGRGCSRPSAAVAGRGRKDPLAPALYSTDMNDGVEVRELRYFVAVAEELNFSRAAQRLEMAQPPLSKAIRQLERKLGVRLLERTTRRVALTAAGGVLLEQARVALDAVEAAGRRARRAGQPAPRLVAAAKAGDARLLEEIVEAYLAA